MKSIFDCEEIGQREKVIKTVHEDAQLTFEQAVSELDGDIRSFYANNREIDVLVDNINSYMNGDARDIPTGELTHENALLSNVMESYKEIKGENSSILKRGLEYFMTLIQKGINFLRTIYLKHRVVRSKHVSIAKELVEASYDKMVTGDNVKYLSKYLSAYIGGNGVVSEQLLNDIVNPDIITDISKNLAKYTELTVAHRPTDVILERVNTNNVDQTELGLYLEWVKVTENAWVNNVANVFVNNTIDKTVSRTILSDRYESIDLTDRNLVVPITTDGNTIVSVIKGDEQDLRIVRSSNLVDFKPSSNIDIRNLVKTAENIVNIDLKTIVESDIKDIKLIEKNAKAFYKTTIEILSNDTGRRGINFNSMATMLNLSLETSSNRLKLINNSLLVLNKLKKDS